MSRTNVVLGGEGLLGRALIRRLRQDGEVAVSFDLKSGCDLRFEEPEAPGGDTYYWFLAWDVGGAKYIMDRSQQLGILRHNLELCQKVFEWLARRGAAFTFIGTQMSTFRNGYGVSKAVGELWASEIGGNVLRLWNIYDAEESTAKSHVIPDLVAQASTGAIRLLTDGSERRQFLHADDCVEALLTQRRTGQRIADASSGEWVSVLRVAEIIGELTGAVVHPGSKPGYESLVDPANMLAGWRPAVGLAEGLRRVIEAMRR